MPLEALNAFGVEVPGARCASAPSSSCLVPTAMCADLWIVLFSSFVASGHNKLYLSSQAKL